MKNKNYYKKFEVIKICNNKIETITDKVISEKWLNVYLNDKLFYQAPVSPAEIEAFIIGSLVVGGFIHKRSDIEIKLDKSNNAHIYSDIIDGNTRYGDFIECFSSKREFEEDVKKIEIKTFFKADTILNTMKHIHRLPAIFKETGGTHIAGLANNKDLLYYSEDISRRSAVNKVIGKAFMDNEIFDDKMLLVSGRISSDMIARLINIRLPLVASKSAPTDKAVMLSKYYGISLCGFVRGTRLNIYSVKERILF